MLKNKETYRPGHRSTGKPLLRVLFIFLLLGLIFATLELTGTTHFLNNPDLTKKIVRAGASTPEPQPNVSGSGSTANKTTQTNNSSPEGGAVDTQGQSTAQTPTSKWVVSASGNITVKQPVANNKIASGGVLSGSAKVNQVNWRLIDNQTGVIAQGTLGVFNGSFSGTLSFTPHSSNGRLDVFSTDANGVELNEVQISVGFNR